VILVGLIAVERRQGTAILTLSRGVTNAINHELVDELSGIVRRLRDDPGCRGLVLTGANRKFFSIGLDIPWLFPLSRKDFTDFYKAFNRLCLDLFTLPKPAIAALAGHAIAGGCILALCGDYRFIAEGKKLMGLNEIKLGVPVPYPADRILERLAGWGVAREIIDSGEFYSGPELLTRGLVDGVLPPGKVLPAAVERAAELGAHSLEAFALIKRNRTEPVRTAILADLDERERRFVERWYAPRTRELLEEAMEKF
jgi:enoyl-CoA hydratase/carnithine racemase